MNKTSIQIIGGGLSGSEAALQLADRGYQVDLYEMRDKVQTPAHKTNALAELVCSNSFKGLGFTSAHGLFKQEIKDLGSRLLPLAHQSSVDAGESLTVDREKFSELVTNAIKNHPNITLHNEEVTSLDTEKYTLVAAGPLCSDTLAKVIFEKIGSDKLSFFDAIAPVVEKDSIDFDHAYYKNRWDKGETQDFINLPLNKEEYDDFVDALRTADQVEPKPFEKKELFEGCLPVEEMARRGVETPRFGPMRPVGLMDPRNDKVPHAVIQLRAENKQKTLYNMVGFQTRLKWGTQLEIFRKVPALKNATFARLGCMHRNTFIDSPKVLNQYLNLKETKVFFAGQITGAEGYTEAVGTGLYAAIQMDHHIKHAKGLDFPKETCMGSLTDFITHENEDFQPMNFNFGLFPDPDESVRKKLKKEYQVNRSQSILKQFIEDNRDSILSPMTY